MCDHVWMTVWEQFLLGGAFAVGYECEKCHTFVAQHTLTPAGLGGTLSTKHKLMGPHGSAVQARCGRVSRRQILDTVTGHIEYTDED